MDKETNIEMGDKSCRNCLSRFTCEEKTEERFHSCDNHRFDDEAATCDDCSKKETCNDYKPHTVTCQDWDPITTCDDCEFQDECEKFMENGKTCGKFKEVHYRLTEKGVFFFSLMNTGLDTGLIDETDFFDVFDHEVKINGLVEKQRMTLIGKKFEALKRLFKNKPEKTIHDIFKELAMKTPYYEYFYNSEETVERVWNEFAKTLADQYSKR